MKHEVTHTGQIVQAFPDEFGIGQAKVARIRMEMAERDMGKAVGDAFSLGHVNPEWRAMKRRLYADARRDYERAKAVLS